MPERRTPPLRTLIVNGSGVVGGAETWLLRLLSASERLRASAVLLSDGPLRRELESLGIRVRVRPTGRTALDQMRAAVWLGGRLRSGAWEAVLANGVKAAACALPAAWASGVPGVWAKHDFSFDRRLARPLAVAARAVVATSASVGRATGRDDVVVVPPPRPERATGRDEARRFWAARGIELDARPALVMTTRLVRYKGVEAAIRALAERGGLGWRLVVVGEDDPAAPGERARLEGVAARAGVAARVAFAGRVPDAARWLAAFDAAAVLTGVDGLGFGGEGFGLAGLEAMAAGVPLIAVAGSPVAAMAADAGNPVLPPGPPETLPGPVARALRDLSAPRARAEAAAAAARIAVRHPDAAESADALTRVLATVAARPGAGLAGGAAVSVVTTVLNEGDEAERLVDRVGSQLRPGDELVVVDGGSSDGTVERLRARAERDSRLRVLVAPGANIPAGRNAGIAAARNPVVACTDAGCIPSPGWLAALRAAFAEASRPSVVTGVYRVEARGPLGHALAVTGYPAPEDAGRRPPLVRLHQRLFGRGWDAAMPTGRSVAFTAGAWRAVGGFPEELPFAEDVRFGAAAAAAGLECVLHGEAEVSWQQRDSVRETLRMYERYGFGDGLSGDRTLVARNLLRLAAYAALPLAGARGGVARTAVVLGAAAYLALPLGRALRRPAPAAAAALVPVAAVLRDLSKAWGCLRGILARARASAPIAGGRSGRRGGEAPAGPPSPATAARSRGAA